MLKTICVFLILILGLRHYITCNKLENNRKQQILSLSKRLGSCSEYFHYVRIDDFINGKLTLPNMKIGDSVKTTFHPLTFTVQSRFNGIFLPNMSSDEVITRVNTGQPITYRVDFPMLRNVPELIKISVNDNELCETKFKISSEKRLILQNTLNTINESLPVFANNINIPNFGEERNESCGLVDTEIEINGATPLAYKDKVTNRGEYPWLAAIYEKQRTGSTFICGGSLLSSKIILTAAHCFLGLSLSAERITAILGQYSLTNFIEDGYAEHTIKAITLHPNYRHVLGFSDADLALVEMQEHVSFNKFIKPICLWSESAEESLIFNHTGVVVGWRSDENGNRITIAPKTINVKIVPEEECLHSSSACARNLDGSEPCVGESGGGLVLNQNGVWMLRGVISLALTIQQRTDLQEYIMYCDIAKHLSWLQNHIKEQKPALAGSVNDICGISGTESRIEHPWLTAIYTKLLTGLLYVCTGSLVSQRSILASANYFVLNDLRTKNPEFIRIYLGRYDLNNIKEKEVVSREVAALLFHPEFRPSKRVIQDNNIVLLQMKDPVSFTQYIKPICLWSESNDQSQIVGQSATLSSWDPLGVFDETSTVPTSIEVNIVSIEECHFDGHNVSSSSRMLCIPRFGTKIEGILMLKQNGRWLLRGVGSRTFSYLTYKFVNFWVYADIAEYVSWIQRNMLS